MTNQPAKQHKQTATGQPTSLSSSVPGSGPGSHTPTPVTGSLRRGFTWRRVFAAIIGWVYLALTASALFYGGLEPIIDHPWLARLEDIRFRSFIFILFSGWTATFVLIVLSGFVDGIEAGICKVETFVAAHIKTVLCLTILGTIALIAWYAAEVAVPRHIVIIPPPIPASLPTPTPTATSQPAAMNLPVVLCASNAVTQPIAGNDPTEIPPQGFVSLDRYKRDLTLKSLVDKLYPGYTYPISIQACTDEKKMVSTNLLEHFDESQQIVFHNQLEPLVPVKEIWVILSANNTAALTDPHVGEIWARFKEDPAATRLAELILGKNIADWTFRGEPQPGTNGELSTKTDFQALPPKGITVNPGDSRVQRVLVDQETGPLPGSDKVVARAAQLLAVRLPVAQAANTERTPLSVMIRDRVGGAGIDVLAVVLIPADFTPVERAGPTIAAAKAVCLIEVAASTGNWSSRNFDEDVGLPEHTYQIQPGCSDDTAVYIPEIDQQVPFYFDKIFATHASTEPDIPYYSNLPLNIHNSIQATHLYLLLAPRNLCVAKATMVGAIDVGAAVEASYPLTAGVNIRQGRTNVSAADCKSGEEALSMEHASKQPSDPRQLVGISGIPLRANPNDRTNGIPAELWLDLVKVPLPQNRSTVKLTVKNTMMQTRSGNEPFFTVYGAALVREQP